MRRTEIDLRSKIMRIKELRAGSIFSDEFESGIVYGLLYSLKKEPILQSWADVDKFIESCHKRLNKN